MIPGSIDFTKDSMMNRANQIQQLSKRQEERVSSNIPYRINFYSLSNFAIEHERDPKDARPADQEGLKCLEEMIKNTLTNDKLSNINTQNVLTSNHT